MWFRVNAIDSIVSSRFLEVSSHSQTVMLCQPILASLRCSSLSRSLFLLIFTTQNSLFVFGIYGFADSDENIIIPYKWSYALNFSEGLAAVTDEKGLSGYINYHGELVIPCIFKKVLPFKNGIANVKLDEVSYYINRN